MAASRDALTLTNTLRTRLLDARQRAAVAVARAWGTLDPDDLQASSATYLTLATAVVETSKRQGVMIASTYLAAYLAAETGRAVLPRAVDPDPYLLTVDGRTLRDALLPPLFTVRAAVAAGRGREESLRMGLARATRTTAVETMDAPRRALGDLMHEDPQVIGWRRVASANACGACLALSTGDVMPPGEVLHAHGSCRCISEPVIRGVRERYRRPTGREVFDALSPKEQAALFAGRGGAEKADLIRSGAVPFDALVQPVDMATRSDQITEAPLSALRSR